MLRIIPYTFTKMQQYARKFLSSALDVLEIAFVALVSVYLIRTFLVQPFVVSGASMTPTFQNGDYLLIDELVYRFRSPERGEVVVFRNPRDASIYFIKRIVGLPGEHVAIRDGKIEVATSGGENNAVLNEQYLLPHVTTGGTIDYVLGDGEYFVLGDNRSFSFDSRNWGLLPAGDIVGLVRFRLWPLSGLTAFAAPQY